MRNRIVGDELVVTSEEQHCLGLSWLVIVRNRIGEL